MSNNWMPECPLSAIQRRAFLYQNIRQFFLQRKVLEVETPVLSRHANTDTQIDVFQTQAITTESERSYLRTSPEFFHKRLLASGSGDIFEIAKVFRLGEQSNLHNSEFTMLEWYRLGFDLSALMDEVAEFVLQLFSVFDLPTLPVRQQSYSQLFETHIEVNPFESSNRTLNDLCRAHGFHGGGLERDAALDFLFAVVIEPILPKDELLFVHGFPASQAALAQINPENTNTCLRFELLWQGVELANGYQELIDAVEQEKRFEADNEWRVANNKSALPIDHNLIDAMKAGLPKCSGVAIGLDRLLMHLIKTKKISSVLPFPAGKA